jgi:hypothetical protein
MPLPRANRPKRGYLANISILPPLIYPFQYNPQRLSDSKSVSWGRRTPISENGGLEGRLNSAVPGQVTNGFQALDVAASGFGRIFSAADLKQFESEGDRTLSIQFDIDGREARPGESERRRQDGTVLSDLAILRSFVYPQIVELSEFFEAATSSGCDRWSQVWFNEPPTALLIMGELTVECYVSSLQINETLFNADLNPVKAEVQMSLIEKTDSYSFVLDTLKRIGRAAYSSAYENIGDIGGNIVENLNFD